MFSSPLWIVAVRVKQHDDEGGGAEHERVRAHTHTLAVDFTASNGDPKDPKSLHAMLEGQYNQYQQ